MGEPAPAPPEETVWEGHPSYWNWWLPVLLSDFFVLGALAAAAQGLGSAAAGGCLGAAAIGHLAVWLRRRGRRYRLTSQRAVMEVGFISRRTSEVEVGDIRSINLQQSLAQRLLGLGDVEISSSAGEGIEVTFQGIAGAARVKEKVRQVRLAAGGRHGD